MIEWQKRVVEEHEELADRRFRLGDFIDTRQFNDLSRVDQELLRQQWSLMTGYRDVLERRIARFGVDSQ